MAETYTQIFSQSNVYFWQSFIFIASLFHIIVIHTDLLFARYAHQGYRMAYVQPSGNKYICKRIHDPNAAMYEAGSAPEGSATYMFQVTEGFTNP